MKINIQTHNLDNIQRKRDLGSLGPKWNAYIKLLSKFKDLYKRGS